MKIRRWLCLGCLLLCGFALALLLWPGSESRQVAVAPPPPARMAIEAGSPQPNSESVFSRFAGWSEQYFTSAGQPQNVTAGIELARERRKELKALIQSDPKRALELAVPVAARKHLPMAVRELLEERVSGRGELALMAAVPAEERAPSGPAPFKANFRTATFGGARYEAFVYGRREAQSTMRNVALNGIAIDGLMAVNEDPSRTMEASEIAVLKALQAEALCAVSEEPATSKGENVAVEVAGEAFFLCGDMHIDDFNRAVIAAEGIENPVGASSDGPAPSAYTEGLKRLIFIRVDFPDLVGGPFTDLAGLTLITNTANYWAEASYHKTTVTLPGAGSDLTPVFRMPNNASYYGTNNFYDRLRSDARAAAVAAGYVMANYEFDIICIGPVPGFGWGGLGYVGAPGSWIRNTSSTGTTTHELGHNLGLNHASFWDTSSQSVIGPGTRIEYGDSFDTMGSGGSGRPYNARYRVYLNWLTSSDWITLTTNGVYRLNAYDVTNSAGIRAMRVIKSSSSATNTYWLEYRQKSTSPKWQTNGVSLRWAGPGNQRSILLDTTPGSPYGKDDCAVVFGRTFSDHASGIHITCLGKAGTTPEAIDIAFNRGTFPANLQPLIAVTASASNVATGVQLTFTASASDPDGDSLAYYWDFGNGDFGTNNPVVRYTYATAGEYVVRCTASDMKGGVATDSRIVRIGSPNTFRIAGRIARPDGSPIEGVRVYVSSSRVTYTDSDGTYTLVGLPAGSYTMNAVLEDFAFTHPAFSNPVSVGPNAANIDFVGGPPSGENLLALVPAGAEWKFLDNGSDQGTAWTNLAFNDITWNEGPAQLGYGDGDEATVVSFGPNSGSKYITTYFRHSFVVDDPTAFATLTLGLVRDDGAIVYLNGREIRRDNMPATVNYTTRALATVDEADESNFFESGVDPSFLRVGTNVLAVQLHQSSSTSSDVSFDLFLNALAVTNLPRGVFITSPSPNATLIGPTNVVFSANASAGPTGSITRVEFFEGGNLLGEDSTLPYSIVWTNAPVGVYTLTARGYDNSGLVLTSTPIHIAVSAPMIARGSTWKYRDHGVDLGTAWKERSFNDNIWSSGPARLGYGGDGEVTIISYGPSSSSKYITTYFRRWFDAPSSLSVSALVFRLQRDDGAVVYLNGAEMLRSNMPDTPVSFGTLALEAVDAPDETAFFETRIELPPLMAGTSNLVAVEIHQANATSSDLGFDLEVLAIGSVSSPPPRLSITLAGPDAELSWPAAALGWTLESSASIGPDAMWSPVPGSAVPANGRWNMRVTRGATPRFFRLQQQ